MTEQNSRRLLTPKFIDSVKPQAKPYRITDAVVPNLGVKVNPTGRKTFNWVGRINGKLVTKTLGTYPRFTLAEARDWAADIENGRERGIDILAVRKDEAELQVRLTQQTVDRMFNEYMRLEGGLTKSANERTRIYRRDIQPHIGAKSIYSIRHNDLANVLQKKIDAGTPIASNAVQSLLRRFFRWSVTEGRHITGLEVDPAANLVKLAKARSRERFLDDEELTILLYALSRWRSPFAEPIRFILYTAARRAEVFEMRWSEIQSDEAGSMVWVIPAHRVKNGKEHFLPLPVAAAALIRSVRQVSKSGFVWPSKLSDERPMSGFSKALKALKDEMHQLASRQGREIEHWTLHDLRRSVASGMNGLHDTDGMSLITETVVERILNHTQAGVQATYNRWKYKAEKKAALDLWAGHLAKLGARGEQLFFDAEETS